MTAAAFCTVTASTKRNTNLGSGKRGAAVAHLTSLAITPLWPVGFQTARLLSGFSEAQIREAKECYHVPVGSVTLPDVREGDVLIVAGVEYPVNFVSEWTDGDIPTLHIVVGEVKSL